MLVCFLDQLFNFKCHCRTFFFFIFLLIKFCSQFKVTNIQFNKFLVKSGSSYYGSSFCSKFYALHINNAGVFHDFRVVRVFKVKLFFNHFQNAKIKRKVDNDYWTVIETSCFGIFRKISTFCIKHEAFVFYFCYQIHYAQSNIFI